MVDVIKYQKALEDVTSSLEEIMLYLIRKKTRTHIGSHDQKHRMRLDF